MGTQQFINGFLNTHLSPILLLVMWGGSLSLPVLANQQSASLQVRATVTKSCKLHSVSLPSPDSNHTETTGGLPQIRCSQDSVPPNLRSSGAQSPLPSLYRVEQPSANSQLDPTQNVTTVHF